MMTTLDKLRTSHTTLTVELARTHDAVRHAKDESEKLRLAGVWFTIAVRRSRLYDLIVKLNKESMS